MTEENYNYRTSQALLRNQFPGNGKLKIPIIPMFQEKPGDFDDLLLIGFDKTHLEDQNHLDRTISDKSDLSAAYKPPVLPDFTGRFMTRGRLEYPSGYSDFLLLIGKRSRLLWPSAWMPRPAPASWTTPRPASPWTPTPTSPTIYSGRRPR